MTSGAGGADTARGITFQSAQAVVACIDLLESPNAETLHVEGREDIVDFELRATEGMRLRVCQAKTRIEPYTWAPADIVAIIRQWQALPDADTAEFEFLTDGSAGPELANDMQPTLRRARETGLTAEDEKYLKSKGLAPDAPLLARVTVASRQPSGDALFERATLRLIRLLELVSLGNRERAVALANELFRLVSIRSGLPNADDRVVTRQELAEVVDVPLDVIDAAQLWDPTTRSSYIESLRSQPPHPSFVALEAERVSLQPDALALVVREQPEQGDGASLQIPASSALDELPGAVISGPAGAGKTTTVELLVPTALDRDLVPVVLSVEGFEVGSLKRLVREALERVLGYRLAPAAPDGFLAGEGATVLLDGAGELDAESRTALARDVRDALSEHEGLRVLLTARNPAALRTLRFPSFVLQGLGRELRRRIASTLLDAETEEHVRDVEARLGSVVANPLLFVMAVGLASQGVHADSRAELFEAFVDGLGGRAETEAPSELAMAVLRDVCFALREREVYATDRWTWLQLSADALGRLAEAKLFETDANSAETVLLELQQAGLVRVLLSGMLSLPHDLFCDYFAAEAMRLQQRSLPAALGAGLEEAAVFLAERGSLSADDALKVCSNPIAAARAAAASPLGTVVADVEVSALYSALVEHFGEQERQALSPSEVRSAALEDGLYVFVASPAFLRVKGVEDDAADARRVAKLPSNGGPLAAAVALWLADLRTVLADTDRGDLQPIPATREQIPDALTAAFHERRTRVDALMARACPGLSDRVRSELGMGGFRALLADPITRTMPIGGGQELTLHPMTYTFNAPDVDVRLAEEADEEFVGAPSAATGAEDWLQEAPTQAALNDVRKALDRLLPGLAR